MVRELDIILNELAQDLRPMAWGEAWFAALPEAEQVETLHTLGLHCRQAHPTDAEGLEAIRRSGLKSTYTPAVLLTRGASQREIGRGRRAPADVRAAEGLPPPRRTPRGR